MTSPAAPGLVAKHAPDDRAAFLVYGVLFALHLASLALIGVLNNRLQSGYAELAQVHAGWAEVHRRTAALSRAAREANEPVNNVFSSSLPAMERDRLVAAMAHFSGLIEAERRALALLPVESQRARLIHNLREGEARLRRMHRTAEEMFDRIARRDKAGADAQMALADRQYGEFLDLMAERDSMVDGLQADLFTQGETYRKGLAAMVVAGTLLLGLVSLVLAGIGIRLARHARRAGVEAAQSTASLARSEHELRAVNRRLEESLLRQRRFIADAAHQLRTPVAGIRIQAARALGADDPEEIRLALTQLDTASRRLARLAEQLLAMAKSEHAASPEDSQRASVDLVELAKDAVRRHLAIAQQRNIDLGLGDCKGPALIPGTRDMLAEMVSNLVDNAVRYSARGGTVTLRVAREPVPFLEVEDDGPGIPAGERERVLEPFYRIAGTQAEGSGLGLAIAHDIALAHGGELSLGAPDRGTGTRVRVTFPGVGQEPRAA